VKKLRKLREVLGNLLGTTTVEFTVDPPDLIVRDGSRTHVIRYLIGEEADFGVIEASGDQVKRFVEVYSSILDKLPSGSEVKIVKMDVDLESVVRKISNEMMNLKALVDVTEEPHIKQRAMVKLRVLESLYKLLISGSGVVKLALVIKIRGSGSSVAEAKHSIAALASIVKNVLQHELGLKVREASAREISKIIRYELGLSGKLEVKQIILDSYRAVVAPIPLSKKPIVESEDALPIGVDMETRRPISIPLKQLSKHVVIIGPTGRGKTTLLATLIENVISLSNARVFAIDYKGDLARMLSKHLIQVLTPADHPINPLVKPEYVDVIEWSLYVSDTLSNTLNVDQASLTRILVKLYSLRSSNDEELAKSAVLDPDLAIFTPLLDLLSSTCDYSKLRSTLLNESVVFDVSGYGSAYQNVYTGLVLGIYKSLVLRNSGSVQRLVVIDEAWRVSKLRTLHELVKEGRSRGIGVVLATQNPSDIPREIVENAHTLVIFGSSNEDYVEAARRILGLSRDLARKLLYLGVGEAVIMNALNPHPVFVKIKPPIKLVEEYSDTTIQFST